MSLDGATKETHESIRVGSTFEKTMDNVERFAANKTRRGLKLPIAVAQMIYMPANQAEADEFVTRWSAVPGIDSVRIKKLISIEDAEMADTDEHPEYAKLSCLYPYHQFIVAADGAVALCCRDQNFKYPLANVRDTPVAEVWNSEAFQRARAALASGHKADIDLCRNCDTVQTNLATRMGLRLLDDFVVQSLVPVVERAARKLGLRVW